MDDRSVEMLMMAGLLQDILSPEPQRETKRHFFHATEMLVWIMTQK